MIFSDAIQCYQAIGASLAKAAPRGWKEIKAEVSLSGNRVDAIVSYTMQEGVGGHLTGVPMLANYFHQLARLVSSEDKGLFRKCHFLLRDDGKFDAQFEY
jgi:hypothetical protein